MRTSSQTKWTRLLGSGFLAMSLIALMLTGATSTAGAVRPAPSTPKTCTSQAAVCPSAGAHATVSFGQLVVDYALNEMGQPYCWYGGNESGPTHGDGNDGSEATDCGTQSINGFDCTGLALYAIYKAGGPDLFSKAHGPTFVNYGTRVPTSSMQIGDILVFAGGVHVGIYAGLVNGKPEMIDANTSGYGRPNGVFEETVAWETYDPSFPLTEVLRFAPTAPPPPPPVPTKTSAANHVLRVSGTGTAYLVDASGVPHWIPDALTYACDVSRYPLWNDVTQTKVNALGNGQPWAARCARPQDAANHILVVSATNTSYWADASGVLHWIPTVAVFDCLSNGGVPVLRGLTQSQVNVLGDGKPWATCSSAPPATDTGVVVHNETAGGAAHTWTDYADGGGTQGPAVLGGETVQIACRASGFAVADGDTWWYQIASSPWDDSYWVSADAFYNDGATSGSLLGTPFYDPAVAIC